jgi:hypothetical protein
MERERLEPHVHEAEVRALARPDPLSDPVLSRELREKYLIWDAFFAGERRVDVMPLVLSERLHRGAVAAAEGVAFAINAASRRAHEDPAEALRYGYHQDVTRLVRASWGAGDRTSWERVDLLLGDDGEWRACEINADCPGGHNEAFGLPRLARAAGFTEGSNPTTMLEDLAAHLAALSRSPEGQGEVGMIFATAWSEDLQICALLKRTLAKMGVKATFAPPTGPRLVDGALTLGGTPVRALYRYFPTEYMEGQGNLDDIVAAVERGLVRTVPSFSQMYAQSKLSFARAWALRAGLGEPHQRALERWTPETVDLAEMPTEQLLAEREHWVLKRALGRVGDQVFVGMLTSQAYWKGLVEELAAMRLGSQPPDLQREAWIAQRLVRQRPIPTPLGDRFLTLGAYVLDGRFVGYFARVTQVSHVSHDALCVPVFVGDNATYPAGAAA